MTTVEKAILAILFAIILILLGAIALRDAHLLTWNDGPLPESVPVIGVWYGDDGEPYSEACIALRGAIYEYTYSTAAQQVTKPAFWAEVPK